jgi:peptidoglycan/xylan/chitin deacetylase (PgdA/CDA1 family)
VVGILVVLVAGMAATRALARSRSFQLFGTLVARVDTPRRVVALTFDDGPSVRYLDDVLDPLAARGVKATFFVTGAEADGAPEATRRIVEAGHEVGNHTYSHARMIFKSPAFVRDEIERTDAAIRAAGFGGTIHFRPPFGYKLAVLPWHLAGTGRTTVTWDVEPDSYPDVAATADGIARHVVERARPGSIVLLHVWYPVRRTSREAVPLIIEGLQAKGFRFVTVGELVGEGSRKRSGT